MLDLERRTRVPRYMVNMGRGLAKEGYKYTNHSSLLFVVLVIPDPASLNKATAEALSIAGLFPFHSSSSHHGRREGIVRVMNVRSSIKRHDQCGCRANLLLCVSCIWFISYWRLSRRHHGEAQESDFYHPSSSCHRQARGPSMHLRQVNRCPFSNTESNPSSMPTQKVVRFSDR